MNKLQQLIFNNGERLVPYVSHGEGELIRHRSSYAFFHSVIASDLKNQPLDHVQVTIADLGFGSGYGCALLSSLPGSQITGIDIGAECEIFARQYYSRPNVNYKIQDISKFVPEAESFDYVVSRGVLEHVPDGVNLIKHIKFRRRVMIDVPYDEKPGNEYHVLTGIKEDDFVNLPKCEFFYEDIEGRIFNAANKPEKSNMIMVVLSAPNLPKVESLLPFPLEPVRDTTLERLSWIKATGRRYYFDSAIELLTAIEKEIRTTEVVMDIEPGIAPMNHFRPKVHLLVEPWREYTEILAYRYCGDKSVIIIRAGALDSLRQLSDNSVDSIFLLDVIEHLEKEEGQEVIIESERVAREQIVIFTPLGFMPQHVGSEEADGWGLSGNKVQEHRSGWEPEDFSSAWSFYICQNFHISDFKGNRLKQVYGAFYAIRNFEEKKLPKPEKMSDFRRPLPSELEVQRLQVELQQQLEQHKMLYDSLQLEYNTLVNSRGLRIIRFLKRILVRIGISKID